MKKIILPLLLSALAFGLAGCTTQEPEDQGEVVETKVLEKITVSGNYKTEYYVGDTFSREGIVVTATYSDGSTKDIKAFTVTGFRSSAEGEVTVTISYTENKVTKSETITVTIIPQPEAVKQDITLSVHVSGIDEYSGKTEFIYINSPLIETEGTGWGTAKLVQDEEDANLWSVEIPNVEVGLSYDYDLYYGDAEAPNWSKGKMQGFEADQHKSLDVVEGTLEYTTEATFLVEAVAGVVTVDLALAAEVYETSTSEAASLNEGVYLWAWIEGISGNQRLTLGEDLRWHIELEVELAETTGTGEIHFTAVLGTLDAPDWTYQMGDYNNGVWEKWDNGFKFDDIDSSTERKEYTCKFNGQPDIPEPSDAANVTFNLNVPTETTATTFTLKLGNIQWHGDNPEVGTFENYTITKELTVKEFNFSILCTNTEGIEWAGIVADASWHAFHVVLDEEVPQGGYVIDVATTEAIVTNAGYVGSATSEHATITVAE